jgi:hypothetical protein
MKGTTDEQRDDPLAAASTGRAYPASAQPGPRAYEQPRDARRTADPRQQPLTHPGPVGPSRRRGAASERHLQRDPDLQRRPGRLLFRASPQWRPWTTAWPLRRAMSARLTGSVTTNRQPATRPVAVHGPLQHRRGRSAPRHIRKSVHPFGAGGSGTVRFLPFLSPCTSTRLRRLRAGPPAGGPTGRRRASRRGACDDRPAARGA